MESNQHESASSEAASTAKRHYLIALLTSLGLSILFWIVFGMFEIVGFVFWTSLAALLGSSIGLVSERNIWVTVLATAVVRIVLFVIMWLVM